MLLIHIQGAHTNQNLTRIILWSILYLILCTKYFPFFHCPCLFLVFSLSVPRAGKQEVFQCCHQRKWDRFSWVFVLSDVPSVVARWWSDSPDFCGQTIRWSSSSRFNHNCKLRDNDYWYSSRLYFNPCLVNCLKHINISQIV